MVTHLPALEINAELSTSVLYEKIPKIHNKSMYTSDMKLNEFECVKCWKYVGA
jgi:hypothetical protein